MESLGQLNVDLLNAVWSGDLKRTHELLNRGANVNVRNNDGTTSLSYAVDRGHLEIVKILLDRGADVDAKNKDDVTPLMMAADRSRLEIVELLLNKGANVNTKDKESNTALVAAANRGHLGIVKILLDRGADVNAKNKEAITSLLYAANRNHLEITKILLDRGADIDAKTNDGDTPLILASYGGHLGIVKILLDRGADVNAKNKNDHTSLLVAANNNYTMIVRGLLNYGADVNYVTNTAHGKLTAIGVTVFKDDVDTFLELLKFGVNLHYVYSDGTTIIDAIKDGPDTLIKKYFKEIIDPISIETISVDLTPLIVAAGHGLIGRLCYFLGKTKAIDAPDYQGRTALHHAIINNQVQSVKHLLLMGADPNIKDPDGKTPWDYAQKPEKKEIRDLLLAIWSQHYLEEERPYRPSGSKAAPTSGGWSRIQSVDIPSWQKELHNDCADVNVTKYMIMQRAVNMGLDRDKVKDLTKDEICRLMINYSKLYR